MCFYVDWCEMRLESEFKIRIYNYLPARRKCTFPHMRMKGSSWGCSQAFGGRGGLAWCDNRLQAPPQKKKAGGPGSPLGATLKLLLPPCPSCRCGSEYHKSQKNQYFPNVNPFYPEPQFPSLILSWRPMHFSCSLPRRIKNKGKSGLRKYQSQPFPKNMQYLCNCNT